MRTDTWRQQVDMALHCAGEGKTEFGTKDAPPTDAQADAATEAATAL